MPPTINEADDGEIETEDTVGGGGGGDGGGGDDVVGRAIAGGCP